MARPHSPKIDPFVRADGTTTYTMRMMVDGERRTIQLGDERDGATPRSAKAKRKDVLRTSGSGGGSPMTRSRRASPRSGAPSRGSRRPPSCSSTSSGRGGCAKAPSTGWSGSSRPTSFRSTRTSSRTGSRKTT